MVWIEIWRYIATDVYEGDLLSGWHLLVTDSIILRGLTGTLFGNLRKSCGFDDDWAHLLFFIDLLQVFSS